MKISDEAREFRNEYQRKWRRNNPEKLKQHLINYWERKADPTGAKVRKLSRQGLSQGAIAEQLNISLGTVNNILNA